MDLQDPDVSLANLIDFLKKEKYVCKREYGKGHYTVIIHALNRESVYFNEMPYLLYKCGSIDECQSFVDKQMVFGTFNAIGVFMFGKNITSEYSFYGGFIPNGKVVVNYLMLEDVEY